MRNAHTQSCEAGAHHAPPALAPSDVVQIFDAEAKGKLLGRERLMRFIAAQQTGRRPIAADRHSTG